MSNSALERLSSSKDDSFDEVPVEKVRVGDIAAVRSGARVPLDGEVVSGTSSVDQAPITGESMPVAKKQGDKVFAGTIDGEGALEVSVSKGYSDMTLAKIVHLVEEAQSQKALSQRFVDVFAKYYTPSVMVLALLVFLIPPISCWRGLGGLVLPCLRITGDRLPVRLGDFDSGVGSYGDGSPRSAHQGRRLS